MQMTADILTPAWATRMLEAARNYTDFTRSGRALTGTLALHDETTGVTLRFANGEGVDVSAGASPDATFRFGGTRAGWATALATAPDVPSAAAPGCGLLLEGDPVEVAGNAMAFKCLWVAMRMTSGEAGVCGEDAAASSDEAGLPAPHEIIGRYIEVGDYRAYYESAGEGYPVVCLHSAGADSREYRHVLGHLAGHGFRAIALDLPGHGKSYPSLETLSMPATAGKLIDFVLDFSRALRLERPVYLGCAMTGSLLLRLASEHPGAVAAVISAEGTADFTGVLDATFLNLLNHPRVNTADLMQSMTDGLIGRALPRPNYNECVWLNARNLTPEVMRAAIGIYTGHDIRDKLARIQVPVLHLYGEYDGTVSPDSIEAIKAIGDHVTSVRLAGVGHLPMVEDPAAFNHHVERFLSEVMPALAVGSASAVPTSTRG
jgi:pimeloyl-ACP methyl ester carboxylesterase